MDRGQMLRKRGHEGACSLYVIVETEGAPRYLKIGISRHPETRLAGVESPRELRLVGYVQFPTRQSARLTEAYLHHYFRHWAKRGEWFGDRASDIDAMAAAVLSAAKTILLNPEVLAGKEPRDFFFGEIDENAVEWWLEESANG